MSVIYLPDELNCKLTVDASKSIVNRIISVQYGDGYGMTAPDGLNYHIEKWSLTAAPFTIGVDLETVRTFFNTVGAHQWFAWRPFGELTYKKFKIDKDSLKEKRINTKSFEFSFSITQDFTLGIINELVPANALLDSTSEMIYDSQDSIILVTE